MSSAVAYCRVSTQRQGRSGLGIEAQRAAVARFAEAAHRGSGIVVVEEEFAQMSAPLIRPFRAG